jgi:hypothetical protein
MRLPSTLPTPGFGQPLNFIIVNKISDIINLVAVATTLAYFLF